MAEGYENDLAQQNQAEELVEVEVEVISIKVAR